MQQILRKIWIWRQIFDIWIWICLSDLDSSSDLVSTIFMRFGFGLGLRFVEILQIDLDLVINISVFLRVNLWFQHNQNQTLDTKSKSWDNKSQGFGLVASLGFRSRGIWIYSWFLKILEFDFFDQERNISRDLVKFYEIHKLSYNRPSMTEKIELENFEKPTIDSDSSIPKTFSQVL